MRLQGLDSNFHGSGFRVEGLGFRVQGSRLRFQRNGFSREYDIGFRLWAYLGVGVGLGSRFYGSGSRVQGSWDRVQGLGFRVQGLQGSGFRVQGLPRHARWRPPLHHFHPDARCVCSNDCHRSVPCLEHVPPAIGRSL